MSSHVLRGAAQALSWQKRHDEALTKRRLAVEIIRELDATETGSERYRLDLGGALSDFGESLHATQDLHQAKTRLEEAESLLRGHTGAMASRLNTTQYFVAMNDLRLALVLSDLARGSQRDRALDLWERARARFHSSARVFAAANDDPVLAGREAAGQAPDGGNSACVNVTRRFLPCARRFKLPLVGERSAAHLDDRAFDALG